MGFPVADVLSDENHVSEFVCAICCQLVEYATYTACSHVYCGSCLSEWFKKEARCPRCNTDLANGNMFNVGELRVANPLAHRVLGRIRVRCPLHEQACNWEGDYSELQSHLTNSDSHTGGSNAAKEAQAEALKEQANLKLQQGAFADAITVYNKAIEMCPSKHTLYGNRGAAYFQLRRWSDCVADCRTAVQLQPSYARGHTRMARALCELGDLTAAREALQDACAQCPNDASIMEMAAQMVQLSSWWEEGMKAYKAADYAAATAAIAQLLPHTQSTPVMLLLCNADIGLGKCDRALKLTRDLIKTQPLLTEAYVVRGKALYLSGDCEQALTHVKHALKQDPDNPAAQSSLRLVKKVAALVEAAAQAFFTRQFTESLELYSEVIQVSHPPQHAKLAAHLYGERAKCHLRLKNFQDALQDSAIATYAQDDHKDAYLTRASALHGMGRYQDALTEMEALSRVFQHDTQVNAALSKAQFEVRREQRTDYYALLGVSAISSAMEIKSQYKAKSLICHPDKHMDSEENRQKAEAHFKLLGEALEVLTDDMKRKLYDEGYDKAAIEERVQAAQRAAREHNKDGCSRGGCSGGGCC